MHIFPVRNVSHISNIENYTFLILYIFSIQKVGIIFFGNVKNFKARRFLN